MGISHQFGKGKLQVPTDYIANFEKAVVAFECPLVFDPRTGKQVRLNLPGDNVTREQLNWAGKELASEEIALKMAQGKLDPAQVNATVVGELQQSELIEKHDIDLSEVLSRIKSYTLRGMT